MTTGTEDDKPTVVLDIEALRKQKIKKEEDLANMGSELEFIIDVEEQIGPIHNTVKKDFPIILLDLNSDFFERSLSMFPEGFSYKIVKELSDLNNFLRSRKFQIIVLNYDEDPKIANAISAQIKKKFPLAKTMIMAKTISPRKAQIHSQSAAGAASYYQLPIEAEKIEEEFFRGSLH